MLSTRHSETDQMNFHLCGQVEVRLALALHLFLSYKHTYYRSVGINVTSRVNRKKTFTLYETLVKINEEDRLKRYLKLQWTVEGNEEDQI